MRVNKNTETILGVSVDILNYEKAEELISGWALNNQSKYVCVSNVHMVMEGWDKHDFKRVINESDMTVPDGMPLVWGLKLLGHRDAERVRGPDLMLALCGMAEKKGIRIGLYGGRIEASDGLVEFLMERYPDLKVRCVIVPPFRQITQQENDGYVKKMNESHVGLVFVGVGCPKQELWMHQNRGKLDSAMVGVGAAFDIFAGLTAEAPVWVQKAGLEWLFRFLIEPRRLWKRYLKHNPRFVVLMLVQLSAHLCGKKIFRLKDK